MSKNYLGYGVDEIICDYCDCVIGVDSPEDENAISIKYAGMNNGQHECDDCKEHRHRIYDRYVTREQS